MAAGPGLISEIDTAARGFGGRLFAGALLVAAIFVASLFILRAEKLFTLPPSVAEASAEDLVAFWRGGQLAIEDRAADAYDPAIFHEGLSAQGETLYFRNPPHFFLLLWPFGLMSYGVAKALFLAVSVAALAGIAWLALGRGAAIAAILLSPPAFASLLVLQIGPPIALGLLAALLMARDRPILSGLVLALLTMKPQYGLMAPVFLAAAGCWPAISAAVGWTALLCAISVGLFGMEAWEAFFQSAATLPETHGATLHRDLVTVAQAIGKIGGSEALRSAAQIAAMLAAGAAVFLSARRWPREHAIAFALLASALAAPSFWVYDFAIVAAGLLLLARDGRPWPLYVQAAGAFVWIAPLLPLGLLTMESAALSTLALVAATAAVFIWLAREHGFFSDRNAGSH